MKVKESLLCLGLGMVVLLLLVGLSSCNYIHTTASERERRVTAWRSE